jgi:hypothetical protein
MKTIRFKHAFSQDLGGHRDYIAYATAEIDDNGNVVNLDFYVTTGNGRRTEHPKTLENAHAVIVRELARRVELNDQAPVDPTTYLDDEE